MKTNRFSAIILAAMTIFSCEKAVIEEPKQDFVLEEGLIKVTLKADLTEDTKANLTDGLKVNWDAADQIAVWDGVEKRKFSVVSCEGGSAVFEGVVDENTTEIYATYPYDAFVSVTAATETEPAKVNYTIPNEQVIPQGALADPKALVSLAYAANLESDLNFKNAVSLVKVTVGAGETLGSFVFKGNASEKIVGAASSVVGETGACTGTAVVRVKGSSEALPQGSYFMAISPATFETGFRIIANGADKAILSTDSKVEFARSAGFNLGDIAANPKALITPFVLNNKEDFLLWAANGMDYIDGEEVTLATDINLEGAEWTPVENFYGIFNGMGHKIYNIVVQNAEYNAGFIAFLGDGSATTSAVVKNLIIGSSDGVAYDGVSKFVLSSQDTANWRYAGAIAYAHVGSVIENVVNFAAIDALPESLSRHRLGGIAGTCKANVTIKNCANYGTVNDHQIDQPTSSNKCAIGGITGCADGKDCRYIGCENHGDVSNYCQWTCSMGGIVGSLFYAGSIQECSNSGKITNSVLCLGSNGYSVRLGGVVGALTDNAGSEVIKCHNTGVVDQTVAQGKNGSNTCSTAMGGVVGCIAKDGTVKGCTNDGAVTPTTVATGTGLCIGGIVGYVTGCKITMTKADDGTVNTNNGPIDIAVNLGATSYVGGIIGAIKKEGGLVQYAVNTAKVSSSASQSTKITFNIGGVIGSSLGTTINNCSNSAMVQATGATNDATFQIAGVVGGTDSGNNLDKCENSGTIRVSKGSSTQRVGGIMAVFDPDDATMTNCVNKGQLYVSRASTNRVGQLAGLCNYNTTKAEGVTICEGCVCAGGMRLTNEIYGGYSGIIFGAFNWSEKDKIAGPITVGSTSAPVSILKGIQFYSHSGTPTWTTFNVDESNVGTHLYSQHYQTEGSDIYGLDAQVTTNYQLVDAL